MTARNHLLYRLDLPNIKEITKTIEAVLSHLSQKFSTDFAKVDTSVSNASRITKAYGSLACKGLSTSGRPHRKSSLRVTSGGKVAVTLEQLQKVTALTQESKQKTKQVGTSTGMVIVAKKQI